MFEVELTVSSNEDYKKTVTEGKGVVFLDAYAEWYVAHRHSQQTLITTRCGPCKSISPYIDK
jgi:hypothetical protein